MKAKSIKSFSLVNKRVLVRCDFNVPIDEKGNILDDFKIVQTLPTIKYLIDTKAKVILMSHLGRPDGKVVEQLRLNKVAEKLSGYLNFSVGKADDCIGPEIESAARSLDSGGVLLLENLRFHKEEEEDDPEFAKKLSYLGDIYVNDAFGVCHRNNASVTGITQHLPSCFGLLLEKEVATLESIMKSPERPMITLIGGTKVETKSNFINNISKVSDYVLISGLITKDASEKNIKFDYPEKIISPVGDLGALDINDESIDLFREKILKARTVLWNGPFGKFEDEKYAKGTQAIADAIIKSEAFSVVGGGETVEFLDKQGIISKFSHVSTGGGAMLSFLSGEKLPGLEALS